MEYGRICGPVAGMSPDYKPALRRGIGQRVGRLIRLVIDFITTSIEVLQSKHSSHMVVPPPIEFSRKEMNREEETLWVEAARIRT